MQEPLPFRVSKNKYGWYAERKNNSFTEYLCEDGKWRSDCTKNTVYFGYDQLLSIIGFSSLGV